MERVYDKCFDWRRQAMKSGTKAKESGQYKCGNCDHRVTGRKGKALPPCKCKNPDWRLVEATTGKDKRGLLGRLFS